MNRTSDQGNDMFLTCDNCKEPIEDTDREDNPYDTNCPWEQHLCEDCYLEIWNDLFKEKCSICENKPCEHGRDCWINPWPQIMYLCYVAPKIKNRVHPDQQKIIKEGII